MTTGCKLAFEWDDGQVVFTPVEAEHEDLAIDAVLGPLEAAIHEGGNVRTLPEGLARAMLDNVGYTNDLAEEIEGEVAL